MTNKKGVSAHPGLIVGLDVGSTTVKAVVTTVEDETVLWQGYQRHETRQAETALHFLEAIAAAFPKVAHAAWRIFVTGSGGGALASPLGARFVQEVHAVCLAVEAHYPEVGSVIELGGQDAKIIVFKDHGGRSKQKIPSMNDKCAGGTGVVIDKISHKLGLSSERLCALPYHGQTLHPVAGKCGVFAETDINSLQKQGVDPEELMASLFESIVQQNLSVLTRGQTLRPMVLLLGGPNTYLHGLQACWRHHIEQMWRERGVAPPGTESGERGVVVPPRAEYFAALGAAAFGRQELGDDPDTGSYRGPEALERFIEQGRRSGRSAGATAPLVADGHELDAFLAEYRPPPWHPPSLLRGQRLEAYIGIDAGSTSTKGVLLAPDGELIAKAYRLSHGNPIADAVALLGELEATVTAQEATLEVLGVGTTGYAKEILRKVLRADTAVVETVAHTHAGLHDHPETDVIVDVGGQDIKLIFLKEGRIRDFRLNTQCSAGNGYFLQSTAQAFGFDIESFAEIAFTAGEIPAFNHGCAVFLQSDIVDFQRQGWQANEILAGLAAVLPKNIWLYVAQIADPTELGHRFVLQGGTQRNLAAVKAQVDELNRRFAGKGKACDIRVHRHCGESGAIGAALEARRLQAERGRPSSFIGTARAQRLRYRTQRNEQTRCYFCGNLCLRTFIDIDHAAKGAAAGDHAATHSAPKPPAKRPTPPLPAGWERVIIANCEKGAVEDVNAMRRIKADLDTRTARNPNFIEEAAHSVFKTPNVDQVADRRPQQAVPHALRTPAARRRATAMARRQQVRIGLPRVLNLYACAPFFLGYFSALGIPPGNVVFSDYTDHELYRRGATRGSIDPCFPSKLGIPHVHHLLTVKHRRKPLSHIFFPMIDSMPSFLDGVIASKACPAAVATAEATHAAFLREGDLFAENGVTFKKTWLSLDHPRLCARQLYDDWGAELGLSLGESNRAVAQGLRALSEHDQALRSRQRAALRRLEEEGRVGICVLGRPYHNDPGINHGILDALQHRGYPIFWQDALPIDAEVLEPLFGAEVRSGELRSALAVDDVWKNDFSEHSSRKLWAAKFVARHPHLVAVELSSFKCGHDAMISAVIEQIVELSGTPYFCFKELDENRADGSIQIRTETIDYFLQRYAQRLRPRNEARESGQS